MESGCWNHHAHDEEQVHVQVVRDQGWRGKTVPASPYIGVQKSISVLTPFVEAGFDWQSTSNDVLDFNRNDSYLEYGTTFTVSESMLLKASIVEDRSKSFDLEDRELALGIVVSF